MKIRLGELRRIIRQESRHIREASRRGNALTARVVRILGSSGFNLDPHEMEGMALQGVINITADPADVRSVFEAELGQPNFRYDATGFVRWRVADGAVSVGPRGKGSTTETIVEID